MLDALAQVRVDAGQQRLDNKEERKVEQVGGAAPPLEAHEEPEQVCQVHLDWEKLERNSRKVREQEIETEMVCLCLSWSGPHSSTSST